MPSALAENRKCKQFRKDPTAVPSPGRVSLPQVRAVVTCSRARICCVYRKRGLLPSPNSASSPDSQQCQPARNLGNGVQLKTSNRDLAKELPDGTANIRASVAFVDEAAR